jgi:hypothetical protein
MGGAAWCCAAGAAPWRGSKRPVLDHFPANPDHFGAILDHFHGRFHMP